MLRADRGEHQKYEKCTPTAIELTKIPEVCFRGKLTRLLRPVCLVSCPGSREGWKYQRRWLPPTTSQVTPTQRLPEPPRILLTAAEVALPAQPPVFWWFSAPAMSRPSAHRALPLAAWQAPALGCLPGCSGHRGGRGNRPPRLAAAGYAPPHFYPPIGRNPVLARLPIAAAAVVASRWGKPLLMFLATLFAYPVRFRGPSTCLIST